MKINPSICYLSLAVRALEENVFPEVKSSLAKENVELVRAILNELLKREGPEIDFLQACLDTGEQLCSEILQVLDGNLVERSVQNSRLHQSNFGQLEESYDRLTQRLNSLCVRLSASKDINSRAAVLLRQAAEWELSYFSNLQNVPVDPLKATSPSVDSTPKPAIASQLLSQEYLQDYLNTRRGPLRVTGFSAVPGGYSNQTYFCTLKHDHSPDEEIVVRKSMPTVLAPFLDLDQEFVLLADLHKAGFPSPRPIDLALSPEGIDDNFFTMERLPGRPPGSFFHSEKPISQALLLHLAELLAQLHKTPLEAFTTFCTKYRDPAILHGTIQDCYRRNVQSLRAYVQRVDHLPSPYVTWLFDWVERNIPVDTRPPVLTHGDFNIHNVLAIEDRITGILDWETADFGAPEQDLAYFQSHVSRYMDWQLWLDHYHASGGPMLNPHNMAFCQAYSMLRMTLTVSRKVLDLQLGLSSDIRYTMIQFAFSPALMQMGLDCTASNGGLK